MDADILRIFGCFIIFLVGIALINNGGIDYKIGDTTEVTGNTSVVTHNYDNYNNVPINIFLAVVGAMGITLVLADRARKNGQGG